MKTYEVRKFVGDTFYKGYYVEECPRHKPFCFKYHLHPFEPSICSYFLGWEIEEKIVKCRELKSLHYLNKVGYYYE